MTASASVVESPDPVPWPRRQHPSRHRDWSEQRRLQNERFETSWARAQRLQVSGDLPIVTVSGTIKTETGKGTYRKPTPKSDASRKTVVHPGFAAELLRVRRQVATPKEYDAVFATRNGT